ncbi:hypothetical protein IQ238_12855 [Pleurocapsales cyanobacterium LEGE 06147]|nr:hypothetical protein [Pleurocapsales cyanobacterium LEGE 06147]
MSKSKKILEPSVEFSRGLGKAEALREEFAPYNCGAVALAQRDRKKLMAGR